MSRCRASARGLKQTNKRDYTYTRQILSRFTPGQSQTGKPLAPIPPLLGAGQNKKKPLDSRKESKGRMSIPHISTRDRIKDTVNLRFAPPAFQALNQKKVSGDQPTAPGRRPFPLSLPNRAQKAETMMTNTRFSGLSK